MPNSASDYPRGKRAAWLTMGRSAFVFAGLSAVSTGISVVAPYFSTRLPAYMCLATGLVVSYSLVLIGIVLAVLGMVFGEDEGIANWGISSNLVAAGLPLGAFVIFV